MNNKLPHQAKQQGVALLVALLVIFMLSVMGVSALKSSSIERRMTSNAIESATTFQAAESATDIILNDSDNLSLAWAYDGDPYRQAPKLASAGELRINVDLIYVGDGVAPGFSLGQTSNGFMSLRFDALATAELGEYEAESNIAQGAYRIVPSP